MKKFALILSIGLFSSGYAQDWFQVESGTTMNLNVIDFPSNLVGYIGGQDSLLLKSTDGGQTWERLAYSGVTFIESGFDDDIVNLKFISETIGYMAVGPYSNGIFKTTDGGLNWTIVEPMEDDLCFNYGLFFFGEDDGFLGGSDCFTGEQIHRVDLAGTHPTPIADLPPSGAMVTSIDFLNDSYGIAVGGFAEGGSIMKTIDGGETWTRIATEFDPSVILHEIVIINDTLAYIAYEDDAPYGLLESTDAGESWHYHDETITFFYPKLNAVHQTGNGRIFTAGSTEIEPHGVIFGSMLTETWWNNWSLLQPINSISSYDDSIVWAVGDSGYIVVNVNPVTLSIPSTELLQMDFMIYPNPTQDLLFIKGVEAVDLSKIIIQNYLGEILFEGESLTIDVSTYSSGIYFLTLYSVSGEQISKRFVKH